MPDRVRDKVPDKVRDKLLDCLASCPGACLGGCPEGCPRTLPRFMPQTPPSRGNASLRVIREWFPSGFERVPSGFRVVCEQFQSGFRAVSKWFPTGFRLVLACSKPVRRLDRLKPGGLSSALGASPLIARKQPEKAKQARFAQHSTNLLIYVFQPNQLAPAQGLRRLPRGSKPTNRDDIHRRAYKWVNYHLG